MEQIAALKTHIIISQMKGIRLREAECTRDLIWEKAEKAMILIDTHAETVRVHTENRWFPVLNL